MEQVEMSDNPRLKRPLNLWLDADVDRILIAEKERTKKSRASLINEAVRKAYGAVD